MNLKENAEEVRANLLQTIKFPANLQYLTDRLPKPNYEPLKLGNISNFEGFSRLDLRDGYPAKGEESVLNNNRNAGSRANNRSLVHEQSQHNSSQLPSLTPPKKKAVPQVPVGASDVLLKDRINRQHERVEQQIKKYDEILKRNKNQRYQYEYRKRPTPLRGAAGYHDSSAILNSSVVEDRKDMIKINGIRLDSNKLQGRRDHANHDQSIFREERRDKLPSLKPAASLPRGVVRGGARGVL